MLAQTCSPCTRIACSVLLAWPSPLLLLRWTLWGPHSRWQSSSAEDILHPAFMEATRTCINEKLECVRADALPDWRPRQADIDYATGVMELIYVDRFVVDGKDREKRLEQRHQKALELITMRHGDWRSHQIVHWCRGCCADRAQAVFTFFTLVHGIIVEHAMGSGAIQVHAADACGAAHCMHGSLAWFADAC